MRHIFALIVVGTLGLGLFYTLSHIPFGKGLSEVSKYYVENAIDKNDPHAGATNIVTDIVVLYRGFDTLGEVTVLFLAATGLSVFFFGLKKKEYTCEPSLIVKRGTGIIFPFILLLGVYIFVHGHLTPGGGFPGGVIIATGVLLIYLCCRDYKAPHSLFKVIEGSMGTLFVIVGLIGLIVGGSFLFNFLGAGKTGELVSAGIIPILYIVIGLKVGAELSGLVKDTMEDV